MARCARCLILLFLAAKVCGQATPAITAFNAGEVSPLIEARIDFSKYNNSARQLENMVIHSQGPVSRRPGTKYIAAVADSNYAPRLIPYEYSTTDAYILEFGDLYMRVYREGGQVLDSNGYATQIATPYDTGELFEIQYVQNADEMYLVHPNEPPQVLTRADHNDWSIGDVNFISGPFILENTDTAITLTPSATTGSITVNANTATFFDGNHVGSIWQLRHPRASTTLNGILDANESSGALACEGDYDLNVKGTWKGTVKLERSYDAGSTWNAVYTRYNNSVAVNEDFSDTEEDAGATFRVTMAGYVSGSATYNFSLHDYLQTGVIKITEVNDTNTATATVVVTLGGTGATSKWSEGYWSDYRGFPRTVEFHEERLIFGGSTSFPQTVWGSQTDDPCNMWIGVLDDDAFVYVLPGQNPIQWLLSQNYLMIGTLGGSGRLGVEDEELTPTNVKYSTQARQGGSAYIQAQMGGDAILYVERGGKKVREFVYSLERDKFVAPDLTVLAEHITSTGIVNMAVQNRPDTVLWCVRSDGEIAAMTYLREQEVVGWSRYATDGDFEAASVIPGSDEDEIWCVVKRTIDGNDYRYIEQFQPRDWGSDQADCWFVDSGLSWSGGDAVNISAITKASPCVVTVSTWPTDGNDANLADGDQVMFENVGGMTQLNNNVYTINNPNVGAKTFSLMNSADTVAISSAAYTTYTSGGTVQRYEKTFSGLGHLEGENVIALTDGTAHSATTVSGGAVTLSVWCNKAVIGLPYTSKFETMPIVFDTQYGSTSAKPKRVTELAIDFYQTGAGSYGTDTDNITEIDFVGESTDSPVPLFTGFKRVPFIHGYWEKATLYMETAEPLPMTIRQLIPKVEISQ